MKPDPATLAITPAKPAPPGITSNLINSESRAWNVELAVGITLAPALLLVALRIYARLGLARKLGIDDYICVFATATTIVFNGIVLSLLDHPAGGALGRHIWDVSLLKLFEYQWPSVVEAIFLRISNTLIKVSLLTFYLRIFVPVRRLTLMIWAGLIAVVGFLLAFLIAALILCLPQAGQTTARLIIPKRCFNELPEFTTAGTIFSVVTDLYILFIPIHLLPSLKLSRKRKAAVAGVFFIGFFACLAGITNLVIRFVRYPPNVLNDFTWDIIDIEIAKIVETNVGLMCACMPVASPVLVGPMRRLFALFNTSFRNQKVDDLGTRGYRDIPVMTGTMSHNGRDATIPRATITGLRTLIREISGSGDRREEPTRRNSLHMHTNPSSPRISSMHSGYTTDKGQCGMDHVSVTRPPSR